MDYPTIPEVTNPTSQLSSSILLENADDGGESISRSSSSARLNEPGSSDLTALTGDDIFRMKGLRQNDSISASEVAEQSISQFEGNAEEEREQNGSECQVTTNPLFDPDAAQNDSSQLNEEDIFRMKSLSISRANALSEQAGQSALSQVDSTSNYEDRVNQDEEENAAENEEDDQVENPIDEHDYFRALPQTDLTFSGHYVFGRNRRQIPNLNKDTVVELYYPFDPLCQPPPGLSMDNYLKLFRQSKVYLIGTAHFSRASQEDVRRTIAETQPDVIFIELCQSRMAILSLDEELLLREAKNLTREKIMAIVRENGVVQGLLQVMLLSISAHITSQLGLAPGGEFRAAHRASFNVQGCRLLLGDRPVQITLQRALSSLGLFQRLRLMIHIIFANFSSVTQEDVERCKDKDLLESLLSEMAGEFPQLSHIFVNERDQYMTYVLHSVMQKYTAEKIAAWSNCRDKVEYQPLVFVGVVGLGHMKGIEENWNCHRIDQASLLTIPKPSRFSRAVRFGIKMAVIGGLAYGGYRVGRFAFNKASLALRAK